MLTPSKGSFEKTTDFILSCLERSERVRVLTSLGAHNTNQLFALGEHLALIGVPEWNISTVLRAGRAQCDYERLWKGRQ
jgi:MoaA/NifB/PqqE/SkfB family radical SAM enzyme